ncbi:MAG: late competence development ComFB family protein [Clostridiales bacterium]|nr:late competence development ComFB family protein [Clostridiales bacterium]
MAKKSNKTEQVLKLITKNQELAEAAAEELDKEKEIKENNLEERTEDKSEEMIAQAFTGRSGSTILLNVTEKLVFEYVDEIMGKLKVCNCPTCKNDVIALALNSLPQKYVTTHAGKQFLLLDTYRKQYETDIISALTKACVRVKVSPRH